MKLLFSLTALLLATGMISCKKEGDDPASANITKANEFKASLNTRTFRISDYFADKPIDYIVDDEEIKQETNLFQYVSPWIKDDSNILDISTGQISITQNDNKIEGNPDVVIIKPVSIVADNTGVYFNFLNYLYEPLKYRLEEFGTDYFIVSADWAGGAKVFTKFTVLQ